MEEGPGKEGMVSRKSAEEGRGGEVEREGRSASEVSAVGSGF